MAILLYDQLSKSSDVLLHPKTHEDFAKIEPGSLVELAGRVEKNAVDTMIDYIEIVNLLSGMSRSSESKEKKIDRNHLDQIRKVLDEDRKRTPLSNITVRCDVPKDLNAVVTLRRDNLRDLTLSELHKNTVRIVGKVTRIVNAGSSMSAFENYGLALMKPSTLTELLKGVSSNSDITADFSEVEIAGPAVQILPLMIYV